MFTILALISAVAVVGVISEILASRKCPDEELLKAVVLGRFRGRDKVSDGVTRHLGICKDCRNKVDQFMSQELDDAAEDVLISDD